MKIIPLNESDEMLVRKALRNDANAEEKLFKRFSPKMLAVCRRYIQDLHYAEDVMITGFTKVFENLSRFRFEGNFEGWIRRIMVRESIDFLRSRKQMQFSDIDDAQFFEIEAPESEYDVRTLQLLIDALPDGYKTVLVMFAIDDYSHKEIATTLGISES
ncbi:MAG: RNA polymerase sigma factor, partial [Proteobacteria bacterium]